MSFSVLLLLWLIDLLGGSLLSDWRDALNLFSIVGRQANLQKGILNGADVLFFVTFVEEINKSSVKTLIYASSSSVYGVKEEENVTEELPCSPLTDYSRYKSMCENLALKSISKEVCFTIVRPSTVCGYSRRQRFDLVVNILTLSALTRSEIKVEGGDQFRYLFLCSKKLFLLIH